MSAADEFGLGKTASLSVVGTDEPPTSLASVEREASGAIYRHPSVALFGVIGLAALLLERTTRPIARGEAKGRVGKASAGIEGEI